ncbi:MAG: amidase [Rhodothermales bacterium]
MPSIPTLAQFAQQMQSGATSSLKLVNESIERIEDTSGEGHLAFLKVDTKAARAAASASDQLRQSGSTLSPLMGIPVSVKDLFDVAGQITRAGSKLLNDAAPAAADATCVDLLRRAGAIIIGRTNMTEFAYSGLGLNPHYGTPASPYDRKTRRIPGGSSAGAGVSVADQMAVIGMGTDTGGSVRIPAALCGVTGFKPSTGRVSTKGALPLSTTYDSIGPLAPSVSCCITVDQILTQQAPAPLSPFPLKNCRLAIPSGIATDHLDKSVTASFEAAIATLAQAGAHIGEVRFDPIEDPMRPSNSGKLLAAEAYAWHRTYLKEQSTHYDQRVSTRMMQAADTSAADYIDLLNWRRHFLHDIKIAMEPYDALILPTTPAIAPSISALESSDERYFSANVLMLRNTSIINQIDGCALSIPCHEPNTPPVGLMIAGASMQDEKILRIGLAIEKLVGL